MTTKRLINTTVICLFLALNFTFVSCSDSDDNDDNGGTPNPENTKYLVGAEVDAEGYYLTTDNISSGSISIVGNGAEGYANLSVTVDGYLYILNNTEGLTEKFELTENGPVKVDAISNAVLTPGAFFRYIQATDNGDLFLSNNPDDNGQVPYGIIDIDTFSATSSGFIAFPSVENKTNLWSNGLVQGDKIYFGTLYGDPATWGQLSENLITVIFDYPSLTNPTVIESDASAGMTAGYRTNGSFATENGEIYQYNITSSLWYGNDEVANEPSVFVRITDGDYDDYKLDVSAHFNEPISIWNAWYAGNGIAYANVVRVADVPEWGDLNQNTGTLVEIDLYNNTVTELTLPKASFVNIFTLDCVENGKFYIPVSITGGDASIYELTIGGGASAYSKGASLDGSNVYVNALFRNF
ncbi:DUF4374 domain-containing protein [Pseudotamlana agarivorans]|uniref:DUF4374 domain-containing protein n=1 Tax=Pseudotamlana agarivorans TaxID=481183 RepID=UPI00082C784E|nr:hypothetical protein [Tamlana agarivorans]